MPERKQIPSSEFQKTYQRLTEPHDVTVLGRVIAHYFPVGTMPEDSAASGEGVVRDLHLGSPAPIVRPVPKPGKKR